MRGDRLRQLRERDGMTRQELANRLKVHASTVGHWETGAREPSNDTLAELSAVFNVSTDYLIGIDEASEESETVRRRIDTAIADSPDPVEDLICIWRAIRGRPELQHLIAQLSEFDDDTIRKVIRVIGALELGDGTHNT